MDQDLVIRRRVIQPPDLALIRQLILAEGARGRSHLSNRLCELWDWRQANGRYRQIACRDLLRRLRADWQAVYGQDLALAETFIEADRFRGSAYAAANRVCVGQTQGRGRNDRAFAQALPVKTVWVYPLRADFRAVLSQGA